MLDFGEGGDKTREYNTRADKTRGDNTLSRSGQGRRPKSSQDKGRQDKRGQDKGRQDKRVSDKRRQDKRGQDKRRQGAPLGPAQAQPRPSTEKNADRMLACGPYACVRTVCLCAWGDKTRGDKIKVDKKR